MKMKNILKLAALAAVLTGVASCSNDEDTDITIIKGTQAALDQACADWKKARAFNNSNVGVLIV